MVVYDSLSYVSHAKVVRILNFCVFTFFAVPERNLHEAFVQCSPMI